MKTFNDQWNLQKNLVAPVHSLYKDEEFEYWSKEETKVEGDGEIRKIDIIHDEEGSKYIIATASYRHEKNDNDDLSENHHIACLIVFKVVRKDQHHFEHVT